MALPETSPAVLEALSDSELKAQAAKALAQADDDISASEREKMEKRSYTWQFEAKSRGKTITARLTHKVPSIGQQRVVNVQLSQMTGGVVFESLSFGARTEAYIAAYLLTCVSSEEPLDDHWSKNLSDLTEFRILEEIYGRCLEHEATFHGSVAR